MTYFRAACDYYLRTISLDGALGIMKKKCQAKGYDGVNVIFVKNDELGDTFCPDFCLLPRDRYYMTVEELKTEITGLDLTPEFEDHVRNSIKESKKSGSLVFVMIYQKGSVELFISS